MTWGLAAAAFWAGDIAVLVAAFLSARVRHACAVAAWWMARAVMATVMFPFAVALLFLAPRRVALRLTRNSRRARLPGAGWRNRRAFRRAVLGLEADKARAARGFGIGSGGS